MNYIYTPTHIYNNNNTEQTENVELFTMLGMEDFLDDNQCPQTRIDDKRTYAKKITRNDGTIKYTIKMAPDKKLFNPISPIDKDSNSVFLDKVSRSNDKFRSVNQKTFDWYLKFLSTKNTAWLYNAEREAQ